jgi:hypothetical protein
MRCACLLPALLPLHHHTQAAIKTINQNVSVFTVGEMLMGDPFRWATDYIAHWVKDGAIGSAFNYPMVSTMRRTLRVSFESLNLNRAAVVVTLACVGKTQACQQQQPKHVQPTA